jgi:ATP-dependent exoDNAse (exonuclease V) beta subunit
LRAAAFWPIARAVAEFVLADRAARCAEGELTFDDLIQLAADVVVSEPEVRARLRARYHTFLIDEFQDTDAAQFALARAFAAVPDGTIEPGRLFLVGDPKQSIYRFRGADMAVYEAARRGIEDRDHATLDRSRRSTPVLVAWVNGVFEQLFAHGWPPEVSPAFRPLAAVRPGGPAGPAVAVVGGPFDGRAAAVRAAEADAVADACRSAVAEGWEVEDRTGTRGPARYGDIAVLMPTRTPLATLERTFEAKGVPYRVESGSLVYQTQEISDLTNVLAAIDDPGDPVAVLGALRSPALACSDVELARHRAEGGGFNYLAPSPPPGPVGEAFAVLRELHEKRPALSLARLTQEALERTGYVASAMLDRADRDSFRRARFLVERARAFESDGPQPLRAFVDWLEERGASPILDHEGTGLDADEDAVRVLTVHAAKGLEFPIVVAAGFGVRPAPARPPRFGLVDGQPAIEVGSSSGGTRFAAGPVDQLGALAGLHDEAERVRLLYVAMTRARDHLVVSLFHSPRYGSDSAAAKLLAAGAATRAGRMEGRPRSEADARAAPAPAVEIPATSGPEELYAARAALIAAAARLLATSATALRKAGRQDESEPWARGRGSTRLGRAVHAVIQSAPLDADQAAVAGFARAQAVAEAIPGEEFRVRDLALRALQCAAMGRARAAARALREVPFGFAGPGGRVVEGFIDMLIEAESGLEVVDWKTDRVATSEIESRMAEYRLQAGLYVLGLEAATGRRPAVERVTYVFLSPGEERDMGNPASLAAEALSSLDEETSFVESLYTLSFAF